MINHILRSISFILHPLIMPFLGVVFYFSKTPRFIPSEIILAKLISLGILTIILPILLYFLLKTFHRVTDHYLSTTKERIIPLILNSFILLLILFRVLPEEEIPELYYFFLGILTSNLSCLTLVLFRFKASIHMIGTCGLFMFMIVLAIHFQINILLTVCLMLILIGGVATSRLHMKAHNMAELIVGAAIGLIPQLILIKYWL
ncbi:hypothetical protein [Aegicerativicinus sediminis]|uniref:hypothetical protein n=1 Tax=Aegicerativicinus sediminis TaxID=2893202 RepID=UPI001E42CAB8|nr:hypothetical protein [Aegicerativicinus sediminis]